MYAIGMWLSELVACFLRSKIYSVVPNYREVSLSQIKVGHVLTVSGTQEQNNNAFC